MKGKKIKIDDNPQKQQETGENLYTILFDMIYDVF